MREVWLHPNRRILLMAMLPVGLLAGLGCFVWRSNWPLAAQYVGAILFFLALMLLVGLARQMLRPRIAYRDGHVLFNLRAGAPIEVPLDVVEAFFQGQSPAHLPGEARHRAKSINLIARLSQRATDWQQRHVKPPLGNWAEGYITIRGTWCEPITEDTIRQLNRRLAEVRRERQALSEGAAKA